MEASDRTDVLYGLKAIAKHVGLTENQAKHRVAQKLIPTFKVGGTVCARRASIDAWLAEREAAARAPQPEGGPDA